MLRSSRRQSARFARSWGAGPDPAHGGMRHQPGSQRAWASPPWARRDRTRHHPGRRSARFSPCGEFRALWLAQVLSVAGDQLARVALTLLVFDRTHSALLAAVTFAASVVPAFIGGITLSGLADRLPRRQVMIACDLIRVVLVAVMAVSGIPIAVLVVLLFLVTLIGAPFLSARAALYPDILTGDLYVLGTAVTLTTLQFAQVLGFAVGGAVGRLLRRPAVTAHRCRDVRPLGADHPRLGAVPARGPGAAAEADAGCGGGLLAGPPAGVHQPGAADPDAARLAGRLLQRSPRESPRRSRRPSAAGRSPSDSSWRRRRSARRWERSPSAGSSPRRRGCGG